MGKGERGNLLFELCNFTSFPKLVLPGVPGCRHVTLYLTINFQKVAVQDRFPCRFPDQWFSNCVPGSEEEVPQELLQLAGKGPDVTVSPRPLTSLLRQRSALPLPFFVVSEPHFKKGFCCLKGAGESLPWKD